MAMSPAAKPGDGGTRSMTEELSEGLGVVVPGGCSASSACGRRGSIEVNLLSFISVEATKDWHLEEFWEDTVAAAVFGAKWWWRCSACSRTSTAAPRVRGRRLRLRVPVVLLRGNVEQPCDAFGVASDPGFTVPFDLLRRPRRRASAA